MKLDFYGRLLKAAPLGYAYHKMLFDDKNNPVDYAFLDVNQVFADMLGMSIEDILKKRVTEILPGIERDEFDWIRFYGTIVEEKKEKEFEQYSLALDKWYFVKAYSMEEDTFVTFFMDVTDRKKAIQDLERKQQQLRTIIDIDPNYIFAKDEEGKYLLANKAVSAIFQLRPEEVEGKTDRYWASSEEAFQHFRQDDLEVIHSGQTKIIHKELAPRQDGTMGWFQTVKIPYQHPGHPLPAVLGVATDITQRVLAEEEMKEYNEKLQLANLEMEKSLLAVQEADRLKNEFLANMSHEMRTPLNAVIGMGELALAETADPTMENYLRQMIKSGQGLLQMINDILDYAQLEAGRISIKEQVFSVKKMVRDVADSYSKRAQQRSVTIEVSLDQSLPVYLVGDEARLRQVLMNLVSNAVKFTSHGKVTISARQVRETSQQTHLQFQVEDTGIGIPMDQLDKLFKPFAQADGSITRRHEGTGLGLSISRKLVTLMGGNLWVRSQEEEGSTFTFQVPFEAATDLLTTFDEEESELLVSQSKEGMNTLRAGNLIAFDNLVNHLEQQMVTSSFVDEGMVRQLEKYLQWDQMLHDAYGTLKEALSLFDYESGLLVLQSIKNQVKGVRP